MASYEQFVVVRIGEDKYENYSYRVSGTAQEMKNYAEKMLYGDGVVVFKGNVNFMNRGEGLNEFIMGEFVFERL